MFKENDSSFALRVLKYLVMEKDSNLNERTNKVIDTTNATFIELPGVQELKKKVEALKNAEKEDGLDFN